MPQVSLTLYIAPDCMSCDRSLEIVRELRRRLPSIEIRVLDLADDSVTAPDAVFAVPTWLLGDRVVALGNPDVDELTEHLTSLLDRQSSDEA